MAERGRFIVLEGIDGSGTTTQAERLVARLEARGRRTHFTCEPSTGPVGTLLRQVLTGAVLGPGGPLVDPAVALLFAADRLDHLAGEIEPRLAEGIDVVSDRYVISSLAYQGITCPPEWVATLNARARAADLTLFVEVSPEIAAERRAARGGEAERFDELSTQRQIAEAYARVVETAEGLGPVERIDGGAAPDAVTEAIWTAVSNRL